MKKDNEITLSTGLGVAFGTLVCILTDDVGLWVNVGIAIGAAIGSSLMHKKK